MLDEPISVWFRMPASASALFALPGVPSAEAAISPGLVISAGLTAIVEALVPVKNAPLDQPRQLAGRQAGHVALGDRRRGGARDQRSAADRHIDHAVGAVGDRHVAQGGELVEQVVTLVEQVV